MSEASPKSPLDGAAARFVAVAIALGGIAFLGWLHRDDIFPPEPGAASGNPQQAAFIACYQPQAARIEKDASEGEITPEQAALFKSRAEALCADRANKSGATGPTLPLR